MDTPQRNGGGFVRLASDVSLAAAALLWCYVQWSFVAPSFDLARGGDLVLNVFKAAFALTLGLSCAIVLPALVAAMFPTTPAGQMLADTKHRTWGYPVLIGALGFLLYYAYIVTASWWRAQLATPPW
jgi:hypothetical protein